MLLGVMRPGEAMQSAKGYPLLESFYEHFTQREGSVQYNNSVSCCMYYSFDGQCYSHDWGDDITLLVLLLLECYLIWMRGHCQYTRMEESWV